MKKLLLSLIFALALLPSAFALADEVEITGSSEKVFGISPGVRFSVLGLEPALALDIFNLEVEGACAFSSGLDGKQFGFAPSFSVAYNTNPFAKGTAAVFGLEYMYLTTSYTNMIVKTVERDSDAEEVLPGVHSLSIFYKGSYNFNRVFGLLWRVRLPLVIGAAKDGESFNFNITNLPGFLGCALMGFCTTSVGVRFVF